MLSAAMPAQQPSSSIAPHTTDVGHPHTIKSLKTLPQGSQGSSWTQDVTSTRNRAAPAASAVAPDSKPNTGPPSQHSQLRAVSASEDAAAALASFRSSHDEYDRLIGQTLDGRYLVQRKIGEGGMGVVFAARHVVIERPLAIKVLKREVMRDKATITRFIQEAKAASRIGHPNIVDVTDFGTTDDNMTFSVMEFIEGETLGHAIRHGAPFEQPRAIKIAVQIARALGAAHDKGIVHRDLKPENVFLVERDGRADFVKIVDFGIAKVMPLGGVAPNQPRLTRAGSVFGTPEYMSPEQAAGKSDTDGRADIYALGAMLYEMLTGKVPLRGETTVRTLAMVMLDPVIPPSKVRPELGISHELEAVVMKALAKKRETRYQTMAELLAALERVQPIVGKSITGSPVYALSPLPPGADAASTLDHLGAPAAKAVPVSPSGVKRAPDSSPSIPKPGNTQVRQAHEPEFATRRDKPATFDHVWSDGDITMPPTSRRWPLFLLFVLIVAGAAAAIVVVVTSRNRAVAEAPHDASTEIADAALVVQATDAGELADAASTPDDATDIVIVEVPDARRRPRPHRRDAGVIAMRADSGLVNGRGVIIQVITKPENANLYAGYTYTGVGGTNVERPLGSTLDLECRLSGYKPGHVHLVFDGNTEFALCVLKRIKICIKGIKNPFDDCEESP